MVLKYLVYNLCFEIIVIYFSNLLLSPDFFVCGLNPTLPHDVRILKYILRLCDSFPKVVRRSLMKLLPWVNQQHEKTPMNIVASDVVTRDDFVPTIVKLNLKQK